MPNISQKILFLRKKKKKILKSGVLRNTSGLQKYQVLSLNLTDANFISEYSHINV